MLITKEDFESITGNWMQESVLNLANHFHKFHITTNQQSRVSYFDMDSETLAKFKDFVKVGEVTKIEMHLGLTDAAMPNAYTACFLLRLEKKDTTEAFFKLNPQPYETGIPMQPLESDIVPKIFKEMIASNWEQTDNNQIDDLFIAKKENQMVRVHFFEIGKIMVEFICATIINCGDSLEAVRIYAGVDLNKFALKEAISFTPVLGLKLEQSALDLISKYREAGNKDCFDDELFIEYSLPCPPTCPNG